MYAKFIILTMLFFSFCTKSKPQEKSNQAHSNITESILEGNVKAAQLLHTAVKNDKTLDAVKLIKQGANINFIGEDGASALHYAVYNRNYFLIKSMLKYSKKVDVKALSSNDDFYDQNAMVIALERKIDEYTAIKLFEKGADLNHQSLSGNTILMSAIHLRYYDLAKKIIDQGADLTIEDYKSNTALSEACFQGDMDMIHYLIQHGADLKQKTEAGYTPFHAAAFGGSIEVIHFLLKEGLDINAPLKAKFDENSGKTPLMYAFYNSPLETVKLLLEKGANIHAQDLRGWNVLHYCVETYDKVDVLKYLIDKGAKVKKSKIGESLLHIAANSSSTNRKELIDYLLTQLKLDVNAKIAEGEDKGQTPIFNAVYNNNYQLAKQLTYKGADVHIIDHSGITLLHYSSYLTDYLSKEFADYLLKKGLDVNAKITKGEDKGQTPLFYAVYQGNYPLVNFLIDKGADIKIKGANGITLLHYAAYLSPNDSKVLCDYLLKYNVDINAKITGDNGYKGQTPLYYAVWAENYQLAKFLIIKGADLDIQDSDGSTVLYYLISEKQYDFAKYLIEKGANVNLVLNKKADYHAGYSPLIRAIINESTDMAAYLIEKGADVNHRIENGENALHIAIKNNQLDIVELLLKNKIKVNILVKSNLLQDEDYTELSLIRSYEDFSDIAQLLFNYGADPNLYDGRGWNRFHHIVSSGNLEAIELAIKKGAKINARTKKENDTALAILLGYELYSLKKVKLLVENGADINVKINIYRFKGFTPLHYAVYTDEFDLVKYLIEKGADINALNNEKKSPLDLADKDEIIKFLKAKGAKSFKRFNKKK